MANRDFLLNWCIREVSCLPGEACLTPPSMLRQWLGTVHGRNSLWVYVIYLVNRIWSSWSIKFLKVKPCKMYFYGNYSIISFVFFKCLQGHVPPLDIFHQFDVPHATQIGILLTFDVVNETILNPILLPIFLDHP